MQRLNKAYADKSSREVAMAAARAGAAAKGEDVLVLDLRRLATYTDYFVLMSGRSTRHVQGLAEAVESALAAKRITSKNCEGLREGQWVLIDFGDVVVHIFYAETRRFYDLEGLWHDAPRLPLELSGTENRRNGQGGQR